MYGLFARIGIFIVALIAVTPCGYAARSESGSRPNIVLIIIDTLRADRLSCYGFPRPTSPEIDAIAGKGTRFKVVFSNDSWTRPSIGSMITSRYPRSIGIYHEQFDILKDHEVTLAEILKENGYWTVGITANPHINSEFNFQQGFDIYLNSHVVWAYMKPADGVSRKYGVWKLADASAVFQRLLNQLDQKVFPGAAKSQPTYLQINIMDVHRRAEIVRQQFKGAFGDKHYLNGVRQASYDLGNFIEQLRYRPGWENTLFVITSDHGEGRGEHGKLPGSYSHGELIYRSQIMVPLIFYNSADASLQGKEINSTVQLLDLAPSILEYVGIAPHRAMQGASFLSLLEPGKPGYSRPYIIAETFYRKLKRRSAVYTAEWEFFENRYANSENDWDELQRFGGPEIGRKTSLAEKYPLDVRKLSNILKGWKEKHPLVPAVSARRNITRQAVEQLETLGYMQ